MYVYKFYHKNLPFSNKKTYASFFKNLKHEFNFMLYKQKEWTYVTNKITRLDCLSGKNWSLHLTHKNL